jgi:hypothetical protein
MRSEIPIANHKSLDAWINDTRINTIRFAFGASVLHVLELFFESGNASLSTGVSCAKVVIVGMIHEDKLAGHLFAKVTRWQQLEGGSLELPTIKESREI